MSASLLIKIMKEEYVASFVNEGVLYANTIGFFRSYEDESVAVRGDENEGLYASFQAKDIKLEFAGITAEGLIGTVDLRYDYEDETNIYCMTAISVDDILNAGSDGMFPSKNFKEFGEKAIVIQSEDITEFMKRLKNAIETDNNVSCRLGNKFATKRIEYVSKSSYHGAMGVFKKFDEYSWQYEWRIVFNQKATKGPYKLVLGPLHDLVTIVDVDSFIDHPISLVEI
ncbi:hypothetical protein ACET54_11920 [Aeromonas veronii]